jgi:hypothetical protein
MLCNVERSPPFWSFSSPELYTRKPHTIEKVVKIVENMAELLDEDMIHSAVSNVQKSVLKPKEAIFSNSCNILILVKKLQCVILNKTRDSPLSDNGQKSQNFDVFIAYFSNHI